ncbi:MAG: sulfite exporter TauE/SafE family protein [Candidatus Riesia sp.]|nr:sulfite exporter TauE/SafE family protein [Candidatus Riesia sp.]
MEFFTAFFIGILSTGHCMGMCGGIVAFLSMSGNSSNKLRYQTLYNFGRITSYILIAVVINFIGSVVINLTGFYTLLIFKSVSNIVLVIIGCHISNLFYGIFYLERIFSGFWVILSNVIKTVQNYKTPLVPFIIGLFWGQVPCGLVYSTLIWTIGFGSTFKSALLMLCFGMGTLPSMFLLGYSSMRFKSLINNKFLKLLFGLLLIFFGLFNLIMLFFYRQCH